ncbi:hypothetical protein [Sorangium sp. So ce406]|uniref:hypothetical protein n=1 Tax=Sorangium sp. So ce406 TaxID=3133311 RepID=UPI003F5BA2A3
MRRTSAALVRVALSACAACAACAACRRAPTSAAGDTADAGSPGAATARVEDLREELRSAASERAPCASVRAIVGRIDGLLDARPTDAPAWQLLGEALRVGREGCPSEAPEGRHARTPEEAFAASAPHAPPGGGAPPTRCARGEGLRDGRAHEGRGALNEAAAAYGRELYGGCDEGGVHWHGWELATDAGARLGLARVAVARGDGLEARRQLRRLDLDRTEAALRLGDEAEEQELWKRLGDTPPHPYAAATPEAAIAALARAAAEGDARAFDEGVSGESELRPLLQGRADGASDCDQHAAHAPLRLRACLAALLLPDAVEHVRCSGERPRARCEARGRRGSDRRVLEVVFERGQWRVLSGARPTPE